MAGSALWRILLGPDHERILAKLRKRKQPTGNAAGLPWDQPVSGLRLARPLSLSQQPADSWQQQVTLDGDRAGDSVGAPQPTRWHGHEGIPGDNDHAVRKYPRRSEALQPFDVLAARPPQPWSVRIRRGAAITTMVALTLAGAASVASQVRQWLRTDPPAPVVQVSDADFDGAAEVAATDYLAWDAGDKSRRQTALHRVTASGTADGWDGVGRQWADSATAIGRARLAPDRMVVSVRVRVVGFTAATGTTSPSAPPTASSTPADQGGVASAPDLTSPGWTAHAARWLTVAVPLAIRDGRPVITAPPSLVGVPPAQFADAGQATPSTSTSGNDEPFSKSTKDAIVTFLQKYATGELDFVRAPRAVITGLDRAVEFGELQHWRAAKQEQGADAAVRTGTATVTWVLPGDGAGKLTCAYVITLRRHDDRWLLVAIEAATEGHGK